MPWWGTVCLCLAIFFAGTDASMQVSHLPKPDAWRIRVLCWIGGTAAACSTWFVIMESDRFWDAAWDRWFIGLACSSACDQVRTAVVRIIKADIEVPRAVAQ